MFLLFQQEYRAEGLEGVNISFVDNRPLLDMFLMKPLGLLALLDEESHFPKATDMSLVGKGNSLISTEKTECQLSFFLRWSSFLLCTFSFFFLFSISEKFHKNIQNNNYSRPKGNNLTFSIDHYAGTVWELRVYPWLFSCLVLSIVLVYVSINQDIK